MGREGDPEAWHPPWCVIDHGEAGAPTRHEAEGVPIAVTLLESPVGCPSYPSPGEVVAVLHRDGEGAWLYIGDGTHQHLELSLDSWRRVAAVAEELIELHGLSAPEG